MGRKPIYSINEDYFKEINDPKKAFWLGFLCADASIKRSRNNIYVEITQKDDYLLNELVEDTSFTGKVRIAKPHKSRYSQKEYYAVSMFNSKFVSNLLNSGKTLKKHDLEIIPKSIPDKFIPDFIRGYFEGDGCIFLSDKDNWILKISGNYNLLDNIRYFIRRDVYDMVNNIQTDKSVHSLVFHGNKVSEKIINYMYYEEELHICKTRIYYGKN